MVRSSGGARTTYDAAGGGLRAVYTHGRLCGSAGGSFLAACEDRGHLVWAGPSPRVLGTFRVNAEDLVTAVALSEDGQRIVVAARSSFVAVWDTQSGAELQRFRPFENGVVAFCALDRSRTLVAFAAAEGRIRVFECDSGHCTHLLAVKGGAGITSLKFWSKGTAIRLLVGLENGSLQAFDLGKNRRKPVWVAKVHVAAITCVRFARNHDWVVCSGRDKIISVVSVTQGKTVKIVVTNEALESIVVLPGSDTAISAGETGVLRSWSLLTGESDAERTLALPLSSANAATEEYENASDDACIIADMVQCGESGLLLAMSDQSLYSVEVSDGKPIRISSMICGNIEEVYDVRAISPSADLSTAPLSVIVASNSNAVRVLTAPPTHDKTLPGVSVNGTRKGDKLKSKSESRDSDSSCSPEIWQCESILEGHQGIVLAIDTAHLKGDKDHVYLASSSRDKTALIWRKDFGRSKWQCVARAEGHTDAVGAVALHPKATKDDFFVVTASVDLTLKLWPLKAALSHASPSRKSKEKQSGKHPVSDKAHLESENATKLRAKWTVLAHEKDINAVAVSPEGKVIATGSQDRTVRLWDAHNGSLRAECRGHRRGIWSVAFSPTERVVVSSSGDSTVRIWAEKSGVCLRTFEGHLAGVLKVLFISDGTQVASAGADGLLKVWGTRSGICDVTVDAHEDRAWALSSMADGDFLVSGGADGKIQVWMDATSLRAEEVAQLRDAEALLGQRVHDAAEAQMWTEASDAALQLEAPGELKKLLTTLIKKVDNPGQEIIKIVDGLSKKEGGNDKITRLLKYCRDWNAAGGPNNAALAAAVLQAIFSRWPPDRLCDEIKTEQRSLVEALAAHTSRHYARISALGARAHFLDFVLESMKALEPLPNGRMANEDEEKQKSRIPAHKTIKKATSQLVKSTFRKKPRSYLDSY